MDTRTFRSENSPSPGSACRAERMPEPGQSMCRADPSTPSGSSANSAAPSRTGPSACRRAGLARGRGFLRIRPATNNSALGGIDAQTLGVVYVFVPSQPSISVRRRSPVAACVSQAVLPKRRFRPPTAGETPAARSLSARGDFCGGLLVLQRYKKQPPSRQERQERQEYT